MDVMDDLDTRRSARRSALAHAYENERPDIQALVPLRSRRILDLGCSSGRLGAALKRRQVATVVGVELDPVYASDAAGRLDRVIRADLEELFGTNAPLPVLGPFDCLIAGDVLEHLRDPWTVLRRAAELLEHGATTVVSLPNVRFWETLWQVGIRGTWPVRDEGIFDRTHLRFFSASDGMELLQQAGLDVTEVRRQFRARSEVSRLDGHIAWLGRTPLRPFFAYQHVIAGRKR